MSVKRTIIRNTLSNWAGYGVNVIVALFLSPFVVHSLGDDAYGMWTVLVSLTGYYGLLDLGIRSGVGQYVTRYWAKGDMDGINRTMHTALVALSGIAIVGILATGVVVWFLPQWFTIEGASTFETQLAMLIMGVGFTISLPMMIFGTATTARQRFDIANVIGISTRLVSAVLTVVVLRAGYGLVGLAVVDTGCKTLGYIARWIVAYRMLPGLRISLGSLSRKSIKEIGKYSVFSFLIRISEQIIRYTDVIVVGLAMTTVAITYYAIGANLLPYYLAIVNAVALTFTPYATSCDAKGDREALRNLLLKGTQVVFLLAAAIGGGLIFLGRDFLMLWMGPKYVSGEQYASSATVLAILTVASLFRLSQSCGLQVLFGMRRVRFLALLFSIEAAANLALSIVLVQFFGLIGVAVGTLLPMTISQGIVLPTYLLHTLRVGVRAYVLRIVPGPLAMLTVMGAVSWVANRYVSVAGWPDFFLKAGVVLVPAGIVGLLVGTPVLRKISILRESRVPRRPTES